MSRSVPIVSATAALVTLLILLAAPALLQAQQDGATGEPAVASPPAASGTEVSDSFEDPFSEEGLELEVTDPIETFNRGMFWFNDKLYFYLFKPVARAYRVVPEPARVSVGNFFSNLATPVRLVNCLLQLKFRETGTELGRFVVNSTVGLAGLFDPAKSWLDWEEQSEDFGQTLGHYGAGEGIYLVLPVFGPSDIRDGIGLVGDYFVHPVTSPYYVKLNNWEVMALSGFERINKLSLDKDTYEGIKRDSLDPYLFVRNSFLQFRRAKIKE